MQKIREALRLHSEADMAVRQICVSVGASVGTVQSWLSKTHVKYALGVGSWR